MNEPIAIIGIGCRYPGGVNNPQAFWQALLDELDAVTEVPSSRFDLETYYDATPATPGKVMSRWGGYLDDIDRFDAAFFGIAPREADRLDPQQRLLLETAWEALEDAGQVPDSDSIRETGVFVGMWLNDFEARLFKNPAKVDFYMTTGSGRYSASGRLSYILGFQGPSVTLDTACSSSLVAVHLACQSLRSGECELALAGAANVILQPHITIAYSQSKMMAPDGHCKFGDARADGYVRSEGAAVLVLKRLSQALADGDPIYALIRGSAVNNDGKTSGFLATPGSEGQEDMLRKAYANAGISPGQVQYVEAHGTGTNAGDPVEIGALGAVLAEGRAPGSVCMLGSVKTNFGHTEGAAGLAGLIKVALSLKHQMLPASLHFQTPSPKIAWDEIPVRIQAQRTPWPQHDGPAIGGVSSFGIAGTNAHIVLQEAPAEAWSGEASAASAPSTVHAPVVLPLAAQSREALTQLAEGYADLLQDGALHDVVYTAATRRAQHPIRLAAIAPDAAGMRDKLRTLLAGEAQRGLLVSGESSLGSRKVVFVFPGQGGQWVGMGRQLLEHEPAFRAALEACEAAMRPHVDWSPVQALQSGAALDDIDVIQPLIFAVQVGLAAVWRSWGVEPDAIIGHSMGEVAGAVVAGILSLDAGAHIICRRSQLMKRVRGKGAMAVVELTYAEAEAAIAGYEDRLGIAVSNGPRSTVLSGDPAALDEVVQQLQARDVFCRPVKVDVAAHSPHMDALRPELVHDLGDVNALNSVIPVYSTVDGVLRAGEFFDAEYWGANLRQPVLFASAVAQALADGCNTFIEISPHPVLLAAVEQSIRDAGLDETLTLPSMRREEDERGILLESLGALYVAGYPVDWVRLYPAGRVLRLPTYPWQRERFWVDEAALAAGMSTGRAASSHPLLGAYFRSQSGTHYWEGALDLNSVPYLNDHRVQGSAIFPAAGYAELALAAAREVFGGAAHSVGDLHFEEALFLTAPRVVQIMLSPTSPGRAQFHCFSRPADDEQGWALHAGGSIHLGEADLHPSFDKPSVLQERLGAAQTGEQHYSAMRDRRLDYGPAFQGVRALWLNDHEVLADLHLPESAAPGAYQVHPALLDACFQTLLATLGEAQGTYLPVDLDWLRLYAHPDTSAPLWAYARRSPGDQRLVGDVLLLDAEGRVLLAAERLAMQRVERPDEWREWLYETVWEAGEALPDTPPTTHGDWLIFADSSGFADELAESLRAWGERCVTVHFGETYTVAGNGHYGIDPFSLDDYQRLLLDAGISAWRGIIHLTSLDTASETLADLHSAELLSPLSALYLTQSLLAGGHAARLWLVTRDAQGADVTNPAGALLWGFGATLANEHPELQTTRVDLHSTTLPQTLRRHLFSGKLLDAIDFEAEQSYTVSRLRPRDAADARMMQVEQVRAEEQAFVAQADPPGVFDNLKWRAVQPTLPAAGEVLIEVHATGLNFMNVMAALGALPGYPNGAGPLGIECAGRIAMVGAEVHDWQVGDEVVAVAFHSLGTHAVTDARLVARKPAGLSFIDAATLPITYLTAHYALNVLGHMSAGERVLIHAGTGGVGLAAIRLAQAAGAEIWATAGTDEKRAFLRDLGIAHVLDSRSLDFADTILSETDGVDLVLNSLAGEAVVRGLETLRPYGRFLEIGKRDIYDNTHIGLFPFQKNLSYFAVDLDRMARERPQQVGAMLREIMERVEAGELAPLPVTVFAANELADAFRHMAQARHIGKIVITVRDQNVSIETNFIRSDGSYLVTGGLGGLGLEAANWLAQQGARHLVLAGRRSPSDAAQAVISSLEAQGVQVLAAQLDIADEAAVHDLIHAIQNSQYPLRGIIHAAGVLEDSTIAQMDAARFRAALLPKLDGAWNLHTATRDLPLDFFVLYSSVAALLGTAGQSNYAAGNAFMDALAAYRQAQGLPALSIAWGPWSQVGLAAAQANRGGRLAERGLGSLTPAEGMYVLERVMRAQGSLDVMHFDASRWASTNPAARQSTLLAGLLTEQISEPTSAAAPSEDIRALMLAAEPGRVRRTILETRIRETVAAVLGLAANRVDVQKPLRNMGIDSLMTLELRNRLESGLKLSLPATLVFNYPTVAALTGHLAEKLGVPLDAPKSETAPPAEQPAADQLSDLSRDEVEALLAEELKSLDDLLKGN
ncbi:MAG: type I polyketide synthase [Anaerolineae bacterium]|nr:type I polyketide synthase [Anaerolineae bacterium]